MLCILTSMTVVTLGELLSARDDSLRVSARTHPAWITALRHRLARVDLRRVTARVGAMVAAALLALAGLLHRHGLVLAGLASFVVAAALLSAVAALVVAGVSLLFLEVRRR